MNEHDETEIDAAEGGTDDLALRHIDQRGAAAAAAVNAAVAEKQVPAFDPNVSRVNLNAPIGQPSRSRRRGALVAVAAAVALIAAGVGAAAISRGGDEGSTATVPRVELTRYGLAAPPPGYVPLFAGSGEEESLAGMGLNSPALVFGPSADEPRVAVAVMPPEEDLELTEEGASSFSEEGEPVVTTVEGVAGEYSEESGSSAGTATTEPLEPRSSTSGSEGEASASSDGPQPGEVPDGDVEVGSDEDPSAPDGASSETPSDDPSSDHATDDGDYIGDVESGDHEEDDWTSDMEEIQVGERTAYDASTALAQGAIILEVDGRQVIVLGAADNEVVRAVAAVVDVDGDLPVVPAAALPDGWEKIRQVSAYQLMGATAMMRGNLAGWSVFYGPDVSSSSGASDEEEGGGLTLSVTAGDRFDVELMRVWLADVEKVEVRGHEALVAEGDLGEGYQTVSVRWEERPGELVEISSFSSGSVTRDDLLAAAESLVELDDDAVAAIESEAMRRGLDVEGGLQTIGEGQFSNGADWVLAAGSEEMGEETIGAQVELRTSTAGGDGSWSTGFGSAIGPNGEEVDPAGQAFPAGISGSAGDSFGWLYGLIGADVFTVEVHTTEGELVTQAQIAGDGDLRGWVAEIPLELADDDGESQVRVVALAEDGTELANVEVF